MTASYPVFKRRLYRICRTAMSPASDISSSPLGDLIIVQADLLSDCTDPHSLSSQLYDSRSLRQALRRLWGAYQLPKLLFFSRTQHKFSTLLGHRKHPSIFSSKCHYYLRDTTLAKELNDMSSLAVALYFGGILARFERNSAEVERLASELIELSTRYNFALWLPGANVLRGWVRSVCGDTAEGIAWIEQGIKDYRATGSTLAIPMWLALKAEALHLADRTSEALETLREAQTLAERFEVRSWYAELHRLRGVFLARLGADKTQIEASFREAIRIAKQQKAISVIKCAEASYAEYRRQKPSALG